MAPSEGRGSVSQILRLDANTSLRRGEVSCCVTNWRNLELHRGVERQLRRAALRRGTVHGAGIGVIIIVRETRMRRRLTRSPSPASRDNEGNRGARDTTCRRATTARRRRLRRSPSASAWTPSTPGRQPPSRDTPDECAVGMSEGAVDAWRLAHGHACRSTATAVAPTRTASHRLAVVGVHAPALGRWWAPTPSIAPARFTRASWRRDAPAHHLSTGAYAPPRDPQGQGAAAWLSC